MIRLSKQEYSIALTNPFWQNKRLRILKRDDNKCKKCNSVNYLHVHHLKYEGTYPWDTRDINLITLCKSCHKKAHEDKEKAKNSKIMQKIELNEYRTFENDNIVKSNIICIGSKNITDYIHEKEKMEFLAGRLSLLRDIVIDLINIQKSGTLNIKNHSTGEIDINLSISMSFRSTPMSPTKKAKMIKDCGYKPKINNLEY